MELCIKTYLLIILLTVIIRFNPCFNGTMYKNSAGCLQTSGEMVGFNPCFNGTMYKNIYACNYIYSIYILVSILVLMELCIKTVPDAPTLLTSLSFNPCFNGTMYKNPGFADYSPYRTHVSILVLMELCIKTFLQFPSYLDRHLVSILVLMELCIKTSD